LIIVLEQFLESGNGRFITDSAKGDDRVDANLSISVLKCVDEKWNRVLLAETSRKIPRNVSTMALLTINRAHCDFVALCKCLISGKI